MIKIDRLQKNYGSVIILNGVSFTLEQGEKAALVGGNGTGKTTLLKILAGIEDSDTGRVEMQKGTKVGYLPQDMLMNENVSIAEYLGGTKKDEHKVHSILAGFSLNNLDLKRNMGSLSSGQKTKIALTAILLKGADLLLLDEPTNNLDVPSLIWLEDFLQQSTSSAVIVSHDRRFLDKVATKILEIDPTTRELSTAGGKYSEYIERALRTLQNTKVAYRLQQEDIKRLRIEARNKKTEGEQGAKWMGTDGDKMLRGFKRERASKSSNRSKVIERRIDQMEKIDKPEERDPLEISLDALKKSGTLNIVLRDVVAGYEKGFTIGPVSLDIAYGRRVGIRGLNGSGKSTLLKTITGNLLPQSGKVEIGSGVILGNMMQEHQSLPRDKTLLEYLQEKASIDTTGAYEILVRFGFSTTQIEGIIGSLSPGGRARFILALFSCQSVNALLLDEPTNHLDIEAVQALEEALESYTGTVILVSHDRYFIEKVGLDFVYEVSEGRVGRVEALR